MTNELIINEFLENLNLNGINKNTFEIYKKDLETLVEFAKGNNLLEQDKSFIASYTDYLRETYNLNTVYRKLASLKLFYKKMFEQKKIDKLLISDIKNYKNEKNIPEIISEEEFETLYDYCIDNSCSLRDILLIKLLYETGIKLNEALILKKSDIHEEKIIINKNNKQYIIKISDEISEMLKSYLNNTESLDLLFDGLSRQNFSTKVRKYALEAGIKKSISPVKLKNSAIYNFLEEGRSVKELKDKLEYTNIGMTGIYKIRNKSEIKKIYEKIAIGDSNVPENIWWIKLWVPRNKRSL